MFFIWQFNGSQDKLAPDIQKTNILTIICFVNVLEAGEDTVLSVGGQPV